MTRRALVVACTVAVVAAGALGAQQSPPAPQTLPLPVVSVEEAAQITSGWVLLAEGKYAQAASHAETLLGQFPRNPAVLSLAIEAAIGARGAVGSLDLYERWLGNRTADEPTILRRIARAYLYEWSRSASDPVAQLDALKALAADGVPEALNVLTTAANAGGEREMRTLASLGNAAAIAQVINQMNAGTGVRANDIRTLGEARSRLAVPALIKILREPAPANPGAVETWQMNRREAADALGKIGDQQAVAPLKALLDEPRFSPTAAGALLQLGDFSGIAVIRELAESQFSAMRRSAAMLLSSQPDEGWKLLVRGLASDPDAATRLTAALLLAPHDREFAESLLMSLMQDQNPPAIKEDAGIAFAQVPGPANFAKLRSLLRMAVSSVRVAAAGRILSATR